ncbi:sensor histidine kinase [Rhodococcus sp. NPDC058505]|uniref:sensor histidine kinase n=1 Tax=unclassified Rhodococcus (in: high G+C Gram-positive bacteria) TaxID=192944 RepID=UPI003669B957
MQLPHDRGPMPVLRVMTLGAHVLFVLLLAVGVARALTGDANPAAAVALAALLFGWYLAGVWFAGRSAATGRPGYGRLWLGVLVLGWLGLSALDGNFVWVAFPLFFLCFHLLSTAAALASTVAITAVAVAATLWHGTSNTVASILGPVFGAAAAAGMAVVYQQLVQDAQQRRRLYDELARSHHELLSAQDELALVQREAGAVAERERLARDIHDTLAQGFSSIVLLARAGERASDPVAALARIADTAQDNLAEARRVVGALTPSALEDASLASALGRLVGQLRDHTGIDAGLVVDGEQAGLPMEYDVALLRVAQSALANVRLHSRAQQVRVTIAYTPDEVRLDIVDDGVGFDPDAAPAPTSFGLRAMRERLDSLGGSLVVESAVGDGTALAATLPVPS